MFQNLFFVYKTAIPTGITCGNLNLIYVAIGEQHFGTKPILGSGLRKTKRGFSQRTQGTL